MLNLKIVAQFETRFTARSFAEDILTVAINEPEFFQLPGKLNLTQRLVRELYEGLASDPQRPAYRILKKIGADLRNEMYSGTDYFGLQEELSFVINGIVPTEEMIDVAPGFNFVCRELEQMICDKFLILPKGENPLIKLYAQKGYNLDEKEFQNNYGLMSVSSGRELLSDAPRLLDRKYSISVDLAGIAPDTYRLLLDWQKKYSFDLAVHPDPLWCFDGIERRSRIREEVAFGKRFTPEQLQRGPRITTQLYDTNWNNLWVSFEDKEDAKNKTITLRSLTFEEILNDFPGYKDSVVTQGLHLTVLNNFITHIDHEYFFYTIEEFEARKKHTHKNGKPLHGTYREKFKTFKLDRAKIPFDAQTILAPMLASIVENQDLVLEYFRIPSPKTAQ